MTRLKSGGIIHHQLILCGLLVDTSNYLINRYTHVAWLQYTMIPVIWNLFISVAVSTLLMHYHTPALLIYYTLISAV